MKPLMRIALMLSLAVVLLGCATAAQRQLVGITTSYRDASAGLTACIAAIYNQPELEPLRRDLPSNVLNASLAQLVNPNFVSAEQTRLILANHPKYHACVEQAIAQLSQTVPTIAAIVLKGEVDNDNRTVALLQKRLRWGEFLQQWRQAGLERQAELQTESRRLLANLEQAHEAELARR